MELDILSIGAGILWLIKWFFKILIGIFVFEGCSSLVLFIFGYPIYKMSSPEGKKALNDKWMRYAHTLGTFNSRLLMTIFYWVVVTAYALFVKILMDPLRMKKRYGWVKRKTTDLTIEDAMRQG